MSPKHSPEESNPSSSQKVVIILLLVGCAMTLLFGLLSKSEDSTESAQSPSETTRSPVFTGGENRPGYPRGINSYVKQTAEAVVAGRLADFSKNRREVASRYAEKLGIVVPEDLKKFFDAADSGDWDVIDRLYKELEKLQAIPASGETIAVRKLSQIAKEVWGAHGEAHSWPAQALLDYGREVLGSLKPDMVYVGGTEPGRFIPTLFNETSNGEHHVVLTQNALADGDYLDYVNFLYGDRLKTLGQDDSHGAFNQYLESAAERYAHDQQFPDEPKQMRRDEKYKNEGGRVEISGQVAVMSINELLLQKLQQLNPDLSFALEESLSLPSTYNGSIPLGPILELKSGNSGTTLTPSLAANSLKFWNNKINEMTASPEFSASQEAARAYTHMIVAHGNLFSSQNLGAEAEQAYRLAQRMAPTDDLDPTVKLYELLVRNGRTSDATEVLTQFQTIHPNHFDTLQKLVNPNR